jgi:uncharacterized membrane protein YhiD involved in acid resistance
LPADSATIACGEALKMDSLQDMIESFGIGRASLPGMLVNLLVTLGLSQIVAYHYLRFSEVLSNKRKFARIFAQISATTFLVISIVGTSLALSLGLVGALSIVRFRTPIKEPEELAYLYLAIAIGIGMGANEPIVTSAVAAAILIFMTASKYSQLSGNPLRTLLHVTAPRPADDAEDRVAMENQQFANLLRVVEQGTQKVDIRRVDRTPTELNAAFLIEMENSDSIQVLMSLIGQELPGASVSLVERNASE